MKLYKYALQHRYMFNGMPSTKPFSSIEQSNRIAGKICNVANGICRIHHLVVRSYATGDIAAHIYELKQLMYQQRRRQYCSVFEQNISILQAWYNYK